MIAAWRSDLDRILHVFEVRSIVHSLPRPLTVHLQTELALHTHIAVSDVRGLVSDIHRAVVRGQEETDISNQTVGSYRALSPLKIPYNCLDSTQVCHFNCSSRVGTLPLSPVYSENHLPHRRGPVLDGVI